MGTEKIQLEKSLWEIIREEVEYEAKMEPILASFLHLTVLRNTKLSQVLAFHLSSKLSSAVMDSRSLFEIFYDILEENQYIIDSVETDIVAYYERDPTCDRYSIPLLYFKGFHAIQAHRINHWLWENNRRPLSLFIQNRVSEVFSLDIHPAAKIGKGIMSDHGTGVVIGETAVLGDNISMLHGVTLGGSGKEVGDRHPKIGNGVMIGANASILGNIKIGDCARVGAGSVVVKDVPPSVSVVGVPARIVGIVDSMPARDMDQMIDFADNFVI